MENFLNSCRKTSSQLSKLFLGVQATSTGVFFENFANFFVLLYFDWFSLVFGWIFFGRVCKTALYVPKDFFQEKLMVLKYFFPFFNVFRIWAKDFRTYGDNCSAAMSKLHFFRQRNKLTEIRFWKNVHSPNNFRILGLVAPDPQLQFSKVSSNLNFCVRRNILD